MSLKGNTNSDEMQTIEHIVIRGKPYERGLSYGQRMRRKINANLSYSKKPFTALDWVKVHEFINDNYVKAIEKYYPSGLVEMRGIAAGADILLEDVIALNSFLELYHLRKAIKGEPELSELSLECTSAVCLSSATESGHVFMGMNWDGHEFYHRANTMVVLEVHPDSEENIAPFIMLTLAGSIAGVGMNANGLGFTAQTLLSSDDHMRTESRTGLMPITLLGRLFLEAPNLPVALKRMIRTPRHVSYSITVATYENEAINLEATPNDVYVTYPPLDTHFLTACNRFKSDGFIANTALKDGMFGLDIIRDSQLDKHLYSRCKSGTLTMAMFEDGFKNHVGWPESLCNHPAPKERPDLKFVSSYCYYTIANIVMDLTTKTIRVCTGQPCVGIYVDYTLQGVEL